MTELLLVDDEKSVRTTLTLFLKKEGYLVDQAADGDEAVVMMKEKYFDLVITDLKMKTMDGLDVLKKAKEINPMMEVIVLTGHGTVETGVEAMKCGAYDYITKPPDLDEFKMLIAKALEHKNLKTTVEQLQDAVKEKYSFENIIGKSKEIMSVLSMVSKVAGTDSTILISGESGTGKELIARAIHISSRRKNRTFIAINCGAIPESLQESELFGHVRGAFTSAIRDKRGLVEEANGGTLFLDEVGEMSPSAQVKLLRFLQDGEIRRVGENEPIFADVRVLAATNKVLEKAVEEGKFREDLYYRLNVIPIEIPPLRKRRDDIVLLVNHFLAKYNANAKKKVDSFSPEALALLTGYYWPGNVRELENAVERAVILATRNVIMPDDLPPSIHTGRKSEALPVESGAGEKTLDELEKDHILQTLEKHNWNQKKASDSLGISTTTLWRKLKSYGIEPKKGAE